MKKAENQTESPVVTTPLKDIPVGSTIRSIGSKKKWMVADNQATAETPFVHLWSEKANYKLKDVNEEFVILKETKGKLPTRSKDEWTKEMVEAIKAYQESKAEKEETVES